MCMFEQEVRAITVNCRAPGSFKSWQEPIPLHQSADNGDWFVSMMLSPGLHQVGTAQL